MEALADMTPEQLEAIEGIGPKTVENVRFRPSIIILPVLKAAKSWRTAKLRRGMRRFKNWAGGEEVYARTELKARWRWNLEMQTRQRKLPKNAPAEVDTEEKPSEEHAFLRRGVMSTICSRPAVGGVRTGKVTP